MDDDEIVYRQIISGGDPIWYRPGHKPVVHSSAFLPSRRDTDGLSLILAQLRSQIWAAYRAEKPDERYRLACLEAGDLKGHAASVGLQNFELESTPDSIDEQHGEPFAHCVATAINRTQYDSDQAAKIRMKEWAYQVSESVNERDVIGPFEAPTSDNDYRPQPH